MSTSGTLANPELIENVPGHVIPILQQEFDDFDTEAAKFLRGELENDEFTKFRLRQGVYGQRQPDVQMIRVKLPMGGVTPDQLDAFADVIEQHAPLRKGHITTRQNIQIYHMPLPVAAEAIRVLGEADLSSREGGGSTVRNVTGDPRAGVLPGELFDITPYAAAYVRYFVRQPLTQSMPRKIKTNFAAFGADNAVAGIHDIAFIPRLRDGVRGVAIRIGGGTATMPRVAPEVFDFVALDNGDYLRVAEAVLRIFNREESLRVSRARARIKFLVDRIGVQEFRARVDAELRGDWVGERNFDMQRLLLNDDEQAHAPQPPAVFGEPNGDRREFERFARSNVAPQRQQGFCTVEVTIPRGDLTPEHLRGLAEIARDFAGGGLRTTIHQNLVLRWVREESVYAVWQRLVQLGLGAGGADEITDVVSCPGTDSCKLGITSSMGLNRAVSERLASMQVEDPLTRRIHVKISGCPNGCSQHHLADIGFSGAAIKVGEHTIPAYIPRIGGAYENGDLRFGEILKSRLPAKRVPDAVERWVRFYEAERNHGESFKAFAARVGAAAFTEQVSDLVMPVEFSLENLSTFIDWTKNQPFQVERGEGECAV